MEIEITHTGDSSEADYIVQDNYSSDCIGLYYFRERYLTFKPGTINEFTVAVWHIKIKTP